MPGSIPHSQGRKIDAGDISAQLCDAIRAAAADGGQWFLRGGGSKTRLLGRHCAAGALDIGDHRGVVSYRPEEMVLTARAGTPIRELNALLAEQRQCLPFEPGEFDGRATIGGTLASGLSGPARPWRGSVRDAVLGIRLINGHGEHLRFGGEVMKNVAGYDVSRLQAGALGTLGLITEVSLRLLPSPEGVLELERDCPASEALPCMRTLAQRPLPLSGACWYRGVLHLRFAGSVAALRATAAELADFREVESSLWPALREWSLPEFQDPGGFWRFDIAPATAAGAELSEDLIDWAGARRFSRDTMAVEQAQALAGAAGGHAMRMGRGDTRDEVVARPVAALAALQSRIKQAMDPRGVFNPRRLYSWL